MPLLNLMPLTHWLTGFKKIPERLSLSEEKMERGSSRCKRLCWKIVQHLRIMFLNVKLQRINWMAMILRPSDHNPSKIDLILQCKLLHGLRITSKNIVCEHSSLLHPQVETLPCKEMQKTEIIWDGLRQSGKLSCGLMFLNFKFSLETMDSASARLKRRGTIRLVFITQFKSLHLGRYRNASAHMVWWVTCMFVKALFSRLQQSLLSLQILTECCKKKKSWWTEW